MDCSPPGLPVHQRLLELTQTHVYWVSDAIQPPHPLSSPSPSHHQGLFKWVSSLHQVAKVLVLASASVKLSQASHLQVCCCDAFWPPGGAKGHPSGSCRGWGETQNGFEDISGECPLPWPSLLLPYFPSEETWSCVELPHPTPSSPTFWNVIDSTLAG